MVVFTIAQKNEKWKSTKSPKATLTERVTKNRTAYLAGLCLGFKTIARLDTTAFSDDGGTCR